MEDGKSVSESRQAGPQSRQSASRGAHQRVFECLQSALRSGRVLDIPCGSGAFTNRLLRAGYAVTAADIDAHSAVPDTVFRRVDMNERLPFDAAEFDAVVSIEGIEHIERPFDFIRECQRALKPEGVFIITTPNISSLRSRWRWFLTGFHNKCKYPLDETQPRPRHHIRMTSYPELRYMLRTNGFTVEGVTTNRIKAASWLYLPWAPVQRIAQTLIFPYGVRSEGHKRVMTAVARDMNSAPLLFGETLILVARAESGDSGRD